MTFGPIVEKIAYLHEECSPELDDFVTGLVVRANKGREDGIDRAIDETNKAIAK